MIVRRTHGNDIQPLARNLRVEDRAELVAASGLTPLQAVGIGYVESDPCYTVEYRGKPAAIFGVVPSKKMDRFGAIWLAGTDDLHLFSVTFLRESRKWLDVVTKNYDLVGNVVDDRNVDHIRWLNWLGFRAIKKHPKFGHLQLPFTEFVKAIVQPLHV